MDLNGPFTPPPGNPGGVQVKTTAWGSIGNIARPGPGLPGLSRFRPPTPSGDNVLPPPVTGHVLNPPALDGLSSGTGLNPSLDGL